MLTVLPTEGRRAPKTTGLGLLRPIVGNTVGLTTTLSDRYPIKTCTNPSTYGLNTALQSTYGVNMISQPDSLEQIGRALDASSFAEMDAKVSLLSMLYTYV